jgi:hypothetical protein
MHLAEMQWQKHSTAIRSCGLIAAAPDPIENEVAVYPVLADWRAIRKLILANDHREVLGIRQLASMLGAYGLSLNTHVVEQRFWRIALLCFHWDATRAVASLLGQRMPF